MKVAEKADCLFCNLQKERVVIETAAFLAIEDNYPVSPGHLLIIAKKHRHLLNELSVEEWRDLQDAIISAQAYIKKCHNAAGFNVGINDGTAAGQTISHLHVHVIPRYLNDVKDPRGGIRWLFPSKAKYWKDQE